MILATAKVEDVDRFLATFTTKGAEKRREYGSGGSHVFRDPNTTPESGWRLSGIRRATTSCSDPDMPAIFEEGGLQGRPEHAKLAGNYPV